MTSFIIYTTKPADNSRSSSPSPYLVFVTGALAVLSDGFQGLAYQVDITLINVEAKQTKASSSASTDTVQELKSLAHQVVICLVVLAPKKVLDKGNKCESVTEGFNSSWTLNCYTAFHCLVLVQV